MKIFWTKIFLYTFDADNTTFFLKDQKPVTVRENFDIFLTFSGLKQK